VPSPGGRPLTASSLSSAAWQRSSACPPPKAPKPPGPSSDELDRVASLDKEVGVPHFHDPYFAKRLWDTAKNPATRNARLAAFSLGWCVHVACDHAFDATKDDPKLMLNLNKTALTRFAFLVLAWDDARWLKGFKERDGKDHKPLAVAKVATRAQDRPGVITEFAKDIVATFRTRVPKDKQDLLNEQDLDVARLREYLALLTASADAAHRVAARQATAKLPSLPEPLGELFRPLIALPNEWRVNDPDLVATRVVERAVFGNEDDPVRAEDDDITLAQVLAVYASDARATAIARILLFQCFPTRPVPW